MSKTKPGERLKSTFEGPSGPETVLHLIREQDRIERGLGSDDEIARGGRFCRVRRQNDRNTRWLRRRLEQHRDDPPAMLFTAADFHWCINDCRVAGEISESWSWDPARRRAEMRDRKARELPTEHFGHIAYKLVTRKDYPDKFEGHIAVLNDLHAALARTNPEGFTTLAALCAWLQKFDGVGPFYAAQVVADLKFFAPWRNAPDVMSFYTPGPGSERGLARVLGKPLKFYKGNEAAFRRDFDVLFAQLSPEIEQILGAPLSASDFQSIGLCEVDKFERHRVDGVPIQLYEPFDATKTTKTTKATKATTSRSRRVRYKPPAVEPPVTVEPPPAAAPHALPELAAARDPNAPHVLFHDFETRSTVDLTTAGSWRYAADPSTEVLCIAYAVDDEPVQLWVPGDPVPSEFVEAARNPNWITVAHNDAFERVIAQHILGPRHDFPAIPIERRRCSMAMASAAALPASLERAAGALGLPYTKDKAGQALMRRMSGPLPGGSWIEDAASRERLFAYCRQDVEAERALFRALPPLTDAEQALWVLDGRVNQRGFATDGALLEAARDVVVKAETALQAEFAELTGLESTNQTAKLIDWLGEHGCVVTDVQKGTLKHALRRKGLAPEVRRAIELRQQLAHASAAKVKALLAWRAPDGRVRGPFQYHGASTGRWTSYGVQVQNFKRDAEGLDAKIAAVMNGGVGLASPVEAVGDIARAMICAAPEHRLMIADFSGIESRVLAWVSGQESKLAQWRTFDASGALADDPYFRIGIACGLPEAIARVLGKIIDLAFGFMGGVGAWERLAPEDDASDEATVKRYQSAWRDAHPNTVQFWYGIDRAAIAAVRKPGTLCRFGRLTLVSVEEFLWITLPSGRSLSYAYPRLEAGKFGYPRVIYKDVDSKTKQWGDCRHGQGAYGGTWTENVVQAIARDLLAAALVRLEAAGYPIVLHVHDEVVAEVPIGFGDLEEFRRLVTALPDWAEGLPVAAKAREGARFSKPDTPPRASSSSSPQNGADLGDELDQVARNSATNSAAPPDETSNDAAQPITREDIDAINAGLRREGIDPIDFGATPDPDADGADAPPAAPLGGTESATAGGEPGDRAQTEAPRNDGYPRGERRTGGRVATYLYRDHLKNPHTRVEKWVSPKAKRAQYPQSFWVGGRWVSKKPEGWQKIPYHLPEMLAALAQHPSADVFNPEGEKDCETLAALGRIATTNSEGATPLKTKTGKWTPELNKWFHGVRRLFILADNDEVGRAFAEEKARALDSIVPNIHIALFPDVPEGEDVTWWLAHGHTKEELLARCEAAPQWKAGGTLQSIRADQVTMRAINWLWPGRFARGKLGLLVGLPEEAKSLIHDYIAARLTRGGLWPNAEGIAPQGNVVILTAEDDLEDTVVPRLVAAGADLSRVHFVQMMTERDENGGQNRERMFNLAHDLGKLRQKIAEIGDVVAILIDPITAYLGGGGKGGIDSFRDTDVRSVLSPLVAMAAELRAAINGIMHFNKKVDITNALLRISNSLAFGGVARHVFSVTKDEENARRLMARAKNNVASENDNKTLAFHCDVRDVGTDPDSGEVIKAPYVVWEPGYVDVTATEALSAASENKSPSAKEEAKQFLLGMLAGGPVPSVEIEDAAKANCISLATLRRAKDDLKIVAQQVPGKARKDPERWVWRLPEAA